jgi:imidazolonepropionase
MSQIYRNVTGQLQSAPKTEPVLIRGARQLVTLRGPERPRRGAELSDLGIISDGALLIRDGRIAEAGPTRRVENLGVARNAREIDAAGRVVMPGFVDGRTQLWPHASQTGLADDESGHASSKLSALSSRALAARARKVLAGMARHGTTTVCVAPSAAPDPSTELKMLRVLAGLHSKPLDVLAAYVGVQGKPAGEPEALVEMLCTKIMPAVARRKLARFAVGNCRAFEPDVTRRFLDCARKLGFQLRVWAGASRFAVPLAVEMEALSITLDDIGEEEIRLLAGSRTIALLQPASLFVRRSERQALTRTLIESGAAIALASGFGLEDGPTYNMQMILSLACSEMRMSPAEAITAATINAAHALGCGADCGSLEPGKRADVLILNVEDYRDLSERFGINHTHMVLKNGAAIYHEGEVTHWPVK